MSPRRSTLKHSLRNSTSQRQSRRIFQALYAWDANPRCLATSTCDCQPPEPLEKTRLLTLASSTAALAAVEHLAYDSPHLVLILRSSPSIPHRLWPHLCFFFSYRATPTEVSVVVLGLFPEPNSDAQKAFKEAAFGRTDPPVFVWVKDREVAKRYLPLGFDQTEAVVVQ